MVDNDNIFPMHSSVSPNHNYQESISNDISKYNVTISDQPNDAYYNNIPDNHNQPLISNDASKYSNVTISNDASSYNPYQQHISNDISYNYIAMSNDVSYNPPMSNDISYNNNITISQNNDQNNDQHPSPSNNIPSFNSLNITINSPQNISEIFRYGFKIIIMPVTNSDLQDQSQQYYAHSSDNSQI
ncbi:hypothetical protein C1645_816423 [Glomus cerebriforme]|uniref:Uncharacterized protein n=1 Tax=Glomus cerebriforme TaxID=658196 RepID=A0A397TCJ1_9GLOM|nr:hypothetical protein C1645_816423 [Glomus cerebriforme]